MKLENTILKTLISLAGNSLIDQNANLYADIASDNYIMIFVQSSSH